MRNAHDLGVTVIQMCNLKTVFEDNVLKISTSRNNKPESGIVLLAFTGIGRAMGGIDVQQPEFLGLGQDFDSTLFITDKTRSWGNALNFGRISQILRPYTGNKKIYSIGNSMGSFLSIIASGHLPIRKSISFAPQFSINPAEIPDETRWAKYTGRIINHSVTNIGDYISCTTKYYVFSGGDGPDRRHANLFPIGNNIFHYLFPRLGHDIAQKLKEQGHLSTIIHNCFAGKETLDSSIPFQQISPQRQRNL